VILVDWLDHRKQTDSPVLEATPAEPDPATL
jgi:hypothetical protein